MTTFKPGSLLPISEEKAAELDANISVEEWCHMEQNADNPVMKFALLLKVR